MQFTHTQQFSVAACDVVRAYSSSGLYETFDDLDHIGQPQVLEHRVDDDGTVHLEVRYVYTGDLPPGAGAFINSSEISVVERSVTDLAALTTDFNLVTALGRQFRGSGRSTTTNAIAGSTRVVVGELKVGIPFVGRKVERVVINGLAESFASQVPLVEGWIDNNA